MIIARHVAACLCLENGFIGEKDMKTRKQENMKKNKTQKIKIMSCFLCSSVRPVARYEAISVAK